MTTWFKWTKSYVAARSTNRFDQICIQYTYAYSSSVCFLWYFVFCAKEHDGRRKERKRIYGTEEVIHILIEFNNPKSYDNQIGYHMKCRHTNENSLPRKKIHSHRIWNAIETKHAYRTHTHIQPVTWRWLANKKTKSNVWMCDPSNILCIH